MKRENLYEAASARDGFTGILRGQELVMLYEEKIADAYSSKPISQVDGQAPTPNLSGDKADAKKYILHNDFHISTGNYIQFVLIVSGSGTLCINGESHQMKSGRFLILDRSMTADICPTATTILYICAFSAALFNCPAGIFSSVDNLAGEKLLAPYFQSARHSNRYYHIPQVQMESFLAVFRSMFEEGKKKSALYPHIMRLRISEIFVRLSDLQGNTAGAAGLSDEQIASRIVSFISNNYHDKITYDNMANMFCISKTKLFSVFKTYIGCTVSKYIEACRMEHACKQLKNSSETVLNIMLDVGYNDMKMFCKRFKEYTGCTPTAYRKADVTPTDNMFLSDLPGSGDDVE